MQLSIAFLLMLLTVSGSYNLMRWGIGTVPGSELSSADSRRLDIDGSQWSPAKTMKSHPLDTNSSRAKDATKRPESTGVQARSADPPRHQLQLPGGRPAALSSFSMKIMEIQEGMMKHYGLPSVCGFVCSGGSSW